MIWIVHFITQYKFPIKRVRVREEFLLKKQIWYGGEDIKIAVEHRGRKGKNIINIKRK